MYIFVLLLINHGNVPQSSQAAEASPLKKYLKIVPSSQSVLSIIKVRQLELVYPPVNMDYTML